MRVDSVMQDSLNPCLLIVVPLRKRPGEKKVPDWNNSFFCGVMVQAKFQGRQSYDEIYFRGRADGQHASEV